MRVVRGLERVIRGLEMVIRGCRRWWEGIEAGERVGEVG